MQAHTMTYVHLKKRAFKTLLELELLLLNCKQLFPQTKTDLQIIQFTYTYWFSPYWNQFTLTWKAWEIAQANLLVYNLDVISHKVWQY